MHKHKYYKPPKPSTLPQRPIQPESRPEFTTDFTDPDKYKLSELEMVQRKAALQSKNREAARQDLEERRRKLEMGIVDEETRKIFETALTSKKIDINPSIRRNLSQMIQYERERSARKNSKGSISKNNRERKCDDNSEEQNQSQGFEGEIKKTQNFIKQLEKAKKQENIGKAVNILLNEKKSDNFGPTKPLSHGESKSKKLQKNSEIQETGSRISTLNQEETLSNIEQTIKFMQQKLFNPNWNKNKEKQSTRNEQTNRKQTEGIKCSTISEISHQMTQNQFLSSYNSGRQKLQVGFLSSNFLKNDDEQDQQQPSFDIDGQLQVLRANFNKNTNIATHLPGLVGNGNVNKKKQVMISGVTVNDDEHQHEEYEDDCMDTIRKMKDIMESKANFYDNTQCLKHKENNNNSNSQRSQRSTHSMKSQGDVEVDFSLTLNDDEILQNLGYKSPYTKQCSQKNEALSSISQKNGNSSLNTNKTTNRSGYQQMKKSLFDEIDRLENEHANSNTNYNTSTSTNNNYNSNYNSNYNFVKEKEKQQHGFAIGKKYYDEDEQEESVKQIPQKFQFQKNNVEKRSIPPASNNSDQQDDHEIQIISPPSPIRFNHSPSPSSISKPVSNHLQAYQITTSTLTTTITPSASNTTANNMNAELQQLKNLVQGTKKNVSSISIGIGSQSKGKGLMGFDYRGSINIKKHVVGGKE